ncbi:MAG: AAA family ATPase [Bacteroidetes bacterium]|nr:AAA family ATPase [Bacteroidota bacterium]MDA1119040.1 AAA family ATPase [Bacteroidota bacterium]
MTTKIAIVGPESTGKTTLAKALSSVLKAPVVYEYARQYLSAHGSKYLESDLINIAKGQLTLEESALEGHPKILICDTNLLEIEVWGYFKYNRINSLIKKMSSIRSYDVHLLTYPDLTWENDPLREHPDELTELFEVYLQFLEQRKLPYCIIKGTGDARLHNSLTALREFGIRS